MIVYLDKNILQEGLSKTIFHFTNYPALKNILEQDCMYLQTSLRGTSDNFNKNKLFYLCFTRVADGRFGYSNRKPVRIEFDGDALSYRYSGKPIDYWGDNMGKQNYFRDKAFGDKTQSRTENEDRLFSREPVIRDIKKYIKRIDVIINRDNEKQMAYAAKFAFVDNVYVYDNEKNFNARNDKTINEELKNNYNLATQPIENRGIFNKDKQTYGICVKDIVNFILYGECNYNDLNKEAIKLLKRYGLEQYSKYVINQLGKHWSVNDYIYSGLNTSDLMLNGRTNEEYVRIMKMLSDYCMKHNISDTRSALEYKRSLNKDNSRIQYDWNKELNVLAFISSYGINHHKEQPTNLYGATVILHPETTCVWDIKELNDNVRPFIGSDIRYYVNSFKSKDEESFIKYLQHIAKSNKITVKEYIDFVNNIDMDEDNKKSYLLNYGMFDTVTLTAMNATGKYPDCYFVSDEDKEEVDKLFQKLNESKQPKKIYLNEDKLALLKEDYRQLEIPFDGNPEKHNYLQFLDHLEEIGEKGTLTSTVDPLKDNETCLNCACDSFYFGYVTDSCELDDEGWEDFLNEFNEKYGTEYDAYDITPFDAPYEGDENLTRELVELGKSQIQGLLEKTYTVENGLIYVERAINIAELMEKTPQYFNKLEHLYDGVGEFWSYEKDSAETYWESNDYDEDENYDNHYSHETVILKGYTNTDSVMWDIAERLACYGEDEIRLQPYGKVQITSIETNDGKKLPLKEPLIVQV